MAFPDVFPSRQLAVFLVLLSTFVVDPGRAVTLQAGAHLDLNVVVMVQKAFTRDGCQHLDQLANDCLRRKCTQNTLYKVDLGYSNVRTTVDGKPLQYPGGRAAYLAEKNRASLELAKKVAKMNNDAFQPFLFAEFERLISDFFDGHARILALFNLTMEELVEEKLPSTTSPQRRRSQCSEMPGFEDIEADLLEMLATNWAINWSRHDENNNETDITFFEVIKRRLPPSPIQMIECYNIPAQKQVLINHTNHLYRLLVRLANESRPLRPSVGDGCRAVLDQVDNIVKNEPLVSRLYYSPVRSLFVRDLEAVLNTKAAKGQHGRYFENNMASLRFRFMSMTASRMEESREYNNFNLMVDLGSTLGLYFGLTILTVFELLIFLFYRLGSHDPTELQKLPPESAIYDLSTVRAKEVGPQRKDGKFNVRQRKQRQQQQQQIKGRQEEEDFVVPVIF